MSEEKLESDLESLRNAVERQLSRLHPPQTALEIINEPNREEYWERFLAYFIDPSGPHGFGTDVLQSFLQALTEAPESTVPRIRRGLDDVSLATQIGSDNGNPDILLWQDENWFFLIEMKVKSGESDDQTGRYADSQKLGPIKVGDYAEDDSHYIYLTNPHGKPPVASEAFDHVRWDHVLGYLESVVEDDRGKYPAKPRSQYNDFIDTIKTEFNMTEYDTDLRERAALAIEYEDAIEAVNEGKDEFARLEESRWQTDFHTTVESVLDEDKSPWLTTDFGSKNTNMVVYHDDWTVDKEAQSAGRNENIIVGYTVRFEPEKIKKRQLNLDFKVFKKFMNSSYPSRVDDYFDEHREQFRPYIEQDQHLQFRDKSKSALFVRDVEYHITDGHSAGEQLAHAVIDTENGLHESVSVLLREAVNSE